MNANNLREVLSAYQSRYCEETTYKALMLDFLEHHPEDAVLRSCSLGHFTASAWLLNRTLDSALMMHHAKLDIWLQLGGHCDGNWDILNVAVQEAREESGIEHIVPIYEAPFDLSIHLVPVWRNEPAHYHYDVRFLLKVVSDEAVTPNRESKELRWITKSPSSLPTTSTSVVRMHEKWCALDISPC